MIRFIALRLCLRAGWKHHERVPYRAIRMVLFVDFTNNPNKGIYSLLKPWRQLNRNREGYFDASYFVSHSSPLRDNRNVFHFRG